MLVKNGNNEKNILESVNTCSNLEGRYVEVHGNIKCGGGSFATYGVPTRVIP